MIPASIAGVTRNVLWIRQELQYAKCAQNAAHRFSHFSLKAFVSLVGLAETGPRLPNSGLATSHSFGLLSARIPFRGLRVPGLVPFKRGAMTQMEPA